MHSRVAGGGEWGEMHTGDGAIAPIAVRQHGVVTTAQRYVLALEELSGCRVSAVGVGPDRAATVVRHSLLPPSTR